MAGKAPNVAADVSKIVESAPMPETGPTRSLTLADVGLEKPLKLQMTEADKPAEAAKSESTAEDAIAKSSTDEDDDEDEDDVEQLSEDDIAFAKELKDTLGTNPEAAMKAVWDSMPQEAQAEFLKQLASEHGRSSREIPKGREGVEFGKESAFEEELLPVFHDLKDIPEFKQGVHQEFQQHATFINDAHLRLAIAETMFDEWGKANGVTIPKPDMAAMQKALKNTGSYEKATAVFKKQIAKAFSTAKQADKSRPPDSRSSQREALTITSNMSLADMIAAARDAAA